MNKQIGAARACITNQRSREGEQREMAPVALSHSRARGKHRVRKNPLCLHLPNMEIDFTVLVMREDAHSCQASSTKAFPWQQPSAHCIPL